MAFDPLKDLASGSLLAASVRHWLQRICPYSTQILSCIRFLIEFSDHSAEDICQRDMNSHEGSAVRLLRK